MGGPVGAAWLHLLAHVPRAGGQKGDPNARRPCTPEPDRPCTPKPDCPLHPRTCLNLTTPAPQNLTTGQATRSWSILWGLWLFVHSDQQWEGDADGRGTLATSRPRRFWSDPTQVPAACVRSGDQQARGRAAARGGEGHAVVLWHSCPGIHLGNTPRDLPAICPPHRARHLAVRGQHPLAQGHGPLRPLCLGPLGGPSCPFPNQGRPAWDAPPPRVSADGRG